MKGEQLSSIMVFIPCLFVRTWAGILYGLSPSTKTAKKTPQTLNKIQLIYQISEKGRNMVFCGLSRVKYTG